MLIAYLLRYAGNDYIAGLGPNLLSEFIGAAVTIGCLDYFIQRRDQRRDEIKQLPIRESVFEDVRGLTSWIFYFWLDAYQSSVEDHRVSDWHELLSEPSITRVQRFLDISKSANTALEIPWWQHFSERMEYFRSHADKVLVRHGRFLEPKVHSALYTFVYGTQVQLGQLVALDIQAKIPRPKNLGSYFAYDKRWFDAVIALHEWTLVEFSWLKENGAQNIHEPWFIIAFTLQEKPTSRIGDAELEAQVRAFKSWQARNAGKKTF